MSFLKIVQLLPVIIAAIKEVEAAFPPGSGKAKLDTVLGIISAVDSAFMGASGSSSLVTSIINTVVSNLFPHTA